MMLFLSIVTTLSLSLSWQPSAPPAGLVTAASSDAYCWYMKGNELWVMDLDGVGQTQIAGGVKRDAAGCTSYRVAPNGRRVVFQTDDGQLMLSSNKGGSPRRLASGRLGAVSWFPDSKRLIYTLNDDIYIQWLDEDRKPETVATGGGRFFFPTFSPDGRNAAFLEAPGGNVLNVIIIRTSDGELRTLGTTAYSPQGTDNLCPNIVSWSPDSTRVLVDYGQPVFVFYLAGGTPTQVGGQGSAPSHFWSPSGNMLAFKEGDGTLWLVNPDGSGQRPLVAEPVGDIAWNPKGQPLIAYTTTQPGGAGDLWVINIQNGQKQQLTGGDTSKELNPAWTPDGKQVVFERQGEQQGIWKVSTKGSDLTQISPTGNALQVD